MTFKEFAQKYYEAIRKKSKKEVAMDLGMMPSHVQYYLSKARLTPNEEVKREFKF